MSATTPLYPDHRAIGTHHAIADFQVRFFRCKGGNRSRNSLSIVRVNLSHCLLTTKRPAFIDHEYRGGFWRALDDVRLNVPLIGEHLSSLRGHTEPFFTLP